MLPVSRLFDASGPKQGHVINIGIGIGLEWRRERK